MQVDLLWPEVDYHLSQQLAFIRLRGDLLCQLGPGPEVRVLDLPVGAVARSFRRDPLGWMGWGYRRPDLYDRYLAR